MYEIYLNKNTVMVSHKRHKEFTEADLKKKRLDATPQCTLKCDAKWNKVFREYLMEKEVQNTEYWTYPDDELDNVLAKYWFEVCSTNVDENGDSVPYCVTSMRSLQNGLTRELGEHNRNIDLTSDPTFKKSQASFKDTCKELKKIRKGKITRYPEILQAGNILLSNFKHFLFHKIT